MATTREKRWAEQLKPEIRRLLAISNRTAKQNEELASYQEYVAAANGTTAAGPAPVRPSERNERRETGRLAMSDGNQITYSDGTSEFHPHSKEKLRNIAKRKEDERKRKEVERKRKEDDAKRRVEKDRAAERKRKTDEDERKRMEVERKRKEDEDKRQVEKDRAAERKRESDERKRREAEAEEPSGSPRLEPPPSETGPPHLEPSPSEIESVLGLKNGEGVDEEELSPKEQQEAEDWVNSELDRLDDLRRAEGSLSPEEAEYYTELSQPAGKLLWRWARDKIGNVISGDDARTDEVITEPPPIETGPPRLDEGGPTGEEADLFKRTSARIMTPGGFSHQGVDYIDDADDALEQFPRISEAELQEIRDGAVIDSHGRVWESQSAMENFVYDDFVIDDSELLRMQRNGTVPTKEDGEIDWDKVNREIIKWSAKDPENPGQMIDLEYGYDPAYTSGLDAKGDSLIHNAEGWQFLADGEMPGEDLLLDDYQETAGVRLPSRAEIRDRQQAGQRSFEDDQESRADEIEALRDDIEELERSPNADLPAQQILELKGQLRELEFEEEDRQRWLEENEASDAEQAQEEVETYLDPDTSLLDEADPLLGEGGTMNQAGVPPTCGCTPPPT